jgi:DNA-binding transcriptional MerR regulator
MSNFKFVTDRQAAEILGLSAKTLLHWRMRGFGPVPTRFGRAVRYSLKDLGAFAASSRVARGGGK